MTIAITIKINDGIVLAADSAAAVVNGEGYVNNVYYNANKIYRIRKNFRIGITSWGSGRLEGKSIENIINDFNRQINDDKLQIDHKNHTVKQVTELLQSYICNAYYNNQTHHGDQIFGCNIIGYDSDDTEKSYVIKIDNKIPISAPTHDSIILGGEIEPIFRLINGYSELFHETLVSRMPDRKAEIDTAFNATKRKLRSNFVDPGMPLQDAIDLARFLVDTAIKYRRYSNGSKTIGGNCDVAVITRLKGFVWINKKKLK